MIYLFGFNELNEKIGDKLDWVKAGLGNLTKITRQPSNQDDLTAKSPPPSGKLPKVEPIDVDFEVEDVSPEDVKMTPEDVTDKIVSEYSSNSKAERLNSQEGLNNLDAVQEANLQGRTMLRDLTTGMGATKEYGTEAAQLTSALINWANVLANYAGLMHGVWGIKQLGDLVNFGFQIGYGILTGTLLYDTTYIITMIWLTFRIGLLLFFTISQLSQNFVFLSVHLLGWGTSGDKGAFCDPINFFKLGRSQQEWTSTCGTMPRISDNLNRENNLLTMSPPFLLRLIASCTPIYNAANLMRELVQLRIIGRANARERLQNLACSIPGARNLFSRPNIQKVFGYNTERVTKLLPQVNPETLSVNTKISQALELITGN